MINENFNCYYDLNLEDKEVQHIPLPSNIIKKYSFLNINNPSFYDLYLYSGNPSYIEYIKPFAIVKQNTLQSVEIPNDVDTNGIFIYPVYNPNNTVEYSKRMIISFSEKSNYWITESTNTKNIVNLKGLFNFNGKSANYNDEISKWNLRGATPSKLIFPAAGDFFIEFYINDVPQGIDINTIGVETDAGVQLVYPIEYGYNSFVLNLDGVNITGFMFHDDASSNIVMNVYNMKVTAL